MSNRVINTGFALPPYWLKDKVGIIDKSNDYWLKDKVVIINNSNGVLEPSELIRGIGNQYPLIFMTKDLSLPDFKFPVDPFISLSFKNIITRRNVAKGKVRGSVKERWTEDDVEITITGTFSNEGGAYPPEIEKLRAYFELHQAFDVNSPYLNSRDIFSIVIDSLDLPHTKGLENQAYQIKAYSDDVFNLLIER